MSAKCEVCGLNPERDGYCLSEKCPMMADRAHGDPMGIIARGFRFIVRGDDATWRKPHDRKPGDVDVTDIDDEEELAAIFVRERDKTSLHNAKEHPTAGAAGGSHTQQPN